jgi:predicted phosphodiesterase
MSSAKRLRIFSDLHFRDPHSRLQELSDFAPLLGDADRVVLNGDSIDTEEPKQAGHLGELRDFTAGSGREFVWLSGNHDPHISPHAELSLCDDRVWVTHGDVFVEGLAPWSRHGAELRRRYDQAAREAADEDPSRIETRLRLHRRIVRGLPEAERAHRPGPLAGMLRLAHMLPPDRLLAMLRVWCATPRVAAEMARAQRPGAQVVVLGHTHFPGVWTLPGRRRGEQSITVINTGSFAPPFGGCFVEIDKERLRVRRIRRERRGFVAGGQMAELGLRKTTLAAG